jgi:predicted porin
MGHTELDAGEEVDTTLYAVGLGYEFTRGVRMMAYYEVLNSESDVAGNADFTDDQQRFYIKCEAKF